MLKILVQIVFSFVIVSSVGAREIPMVQNIKITIPFKSLSVIEFPFEIKDKRFTPFEYKKKKKKKGSKSGEVNPLEDEISLPQSQKPSPITSIRSNNTKNGAKGKGTKKITNFSVSWGKNFLQIFPKKIGTTQLIVWGYRKYPMLITLEVSNDKKKYQSYVKFTDFELEQDKLAKKTLKKMSHEKSCSRLIYHLYNDKVPTGYKLETVDEEYKDQNFVAVLSKQLVGKYYTAKEYRLQNMSDKSVILNEPMFSSEKTYAVTIENRKLKAHESTRLFIVTPTIRD